MKKSSFILLLLLFLFSCMTGSRIKTEKGTPACVKARIKSFSAGINCDKNVNVKKYRFQGKEVYVFDPGSCGADMTSEVTDENCKSLGHLGGFIGNSKINGEDFSNAVFVSLVWEK